MGSPVFRIYSGALLAAALAAGGCGDLEHARGAESLLDVAVRADRTPAEYTAMAMNQYDPNARYIGTAALAGAFFANDLPYLALFEDNADDADPSVRAVAIRGLGNHGEARHAPLLAAALKDPDKLVRLEAARGLQRLHNPEATDALLAAVRPFDPLNPGLGGEPEADIRAEAATALGQYADPRVVEGLIGALRDSSLAVNRAAEHSLRTLTGNDLGLEPAEWVEWRATTHDMFAGRSLYTYPVFSRSRSWIEHLPFVPPPPNEVAAPPAGMPRSP
ncbi:MAG: HEAT repeat domain-containing protein [Phycisphaerales bacterium]|nr:HEAT repeat domain-containing protein [Phycisphaerales bacterium]